MSFVWTKICSWEMPKKKKEFTFFSFCGNLVLSKKLTWLLFVLQNTEENFQKKILNERIARLSGGIAILQVTEIFQSRHLDHLLLWRLIS